MIFDFTSDSDSCRMLLLAMIPIREIQPENIRGVVYDDAGTPGRVHSVKLIMEDGHIHVYSGDDLPLALALAKERFPPEPGSNRMADQPLKD
jgi:hypothetical protein